MSVLCVWSAKGGVGATSVVVLLAEALAARPARPAPLVVDLDGGVPAACGVDGSALPGVADWLSTGSVQPDALARLEQTIGGITVLPRGGGDLRAGRASLLLDLLLTGDRPVLVDAGRLRPGDASGSVGAIATTRATASWLVSDRSRAALLAASAAGARATGLVLNAPRPLRGRPVSAGLLPAPVVADVGHDPRLARAAERRPGAGGAPAGPGRALLRAWALGGLLTSVR